ncbi:MAG: MarR family transcriptional regulator [Kangiellaceae bacterium]|jgi:DNA-binding MarR family transcriptional regulator|nr:MarR family transcriptional regulator [Kangiellaceae bacterium]
MSQDTLEDSLHSFAIHLLRKVKTDDLIDGLSLTPARLSALSVILFAGPVTVSDLAKAEQVSLPTMTKLVQALVSNNFVIKARSKADGRQMWLSTTTKGKQAVLEAKSRRLAKLHKLVENLSVEDYKDIELALPALLKLIQ